jgi:hypothetical protein
MWGNYEDEAAEQQMAADEQPQQQRLKSASCWQEEGQRLQRI